MCHHWAVVATGRKPQQMGKARTGGCSVVLCGQQLQMEKSAPRLSAIHNSSQFVLRRNPKRAWGKDPCSILDGRCAGRVLLEFAKEAGIKGLALFLWIMHKKSLVFLHLTLDISNLKCGQVYLDNRAKAGYNMFRWFPIPCSGIEEVITSTTGNRVAVISRPRVRIPPTAPSCVDEKDARKKSALLCGFFAL